MESKEERKKRILEERKQRRAVQVSPWRRRWVIFKQKVDTKYYEITQNTKNRLNKYLSKQYWAKKKFELQWLMKQYIIFFKDVYIEATVTMPNQIKKSLHNTKQNIQNKLVNAIGSPELEETKQINNYLKKILFHYNQTLTNEEWLSNQIAKQNTNLTHSKLTNVADRIITQAGFDIVDRNKSMYDLMIAIDKERKYRKQREADWHSFGSPNFTVTEKQMRESEKEVDENLKEWQEFLKNFK